MELLRKNREHFHMDNMEIIEALAPEGLEELPVPTHAFIGGSGGRLMDILQTLYRKNPHMRIVINAISMETIAELQEDWKRFLWRTRKSCRCSKPGEEAGKLSSAAGGESGVDLLIYVQGGRKRFYGQSEESVADRRRKWKQGKWRSAEMIGAQEKKIRRIMIAAPKSGSGKTMITCGLLQIF